MSSKIMKKGRVFMFLVVYLNYFCMPLIFRGGGSTFNNLQISFFICMKYLYCTLWAKRRYWKIIQTERLQRHVINIMYFPFVLSIQTLNPKWYEDFRFRVSTIKCYSNTCVKLFIIIGRNDLCLCFWLPWSFLVSFQFYRQYSLAVQYTCKISV